MSGSRPGPYRRPDSRGHPPASTETATYDVVPTSRVSPRVVPGPAYGTRTGPRRGPAAQASSQAGQQARFDPRRFAGRLKRVVVAGSVVGFGVFFALVAEHVVGVTSVRGGTAAAGGSAPSQASSPYDGFFGPSSQAQSGGLGLGGIFGGSGGGSAGSAGTSAGSGLVNGGGGAPMMISSGS